MAELAHISDFCRSKPFFIGIDSDGCAFDTMELKHKECFIPNTVRYFGLQAASKYAREAAEFINLYSDQRGINRFPALIKTLDLLRTREEVARIGIQIPSLPATRDWLTREPKPGNPSLKAEIERINGEARAELRQVLAWSEAVNCSIAEVVLGVPPYPFVRESLQKAASSADIMVVSATPFEALKREWTESGLAEFLVAIAGQEMGTKADQLHMAMENGYQRERALMIGDAPGDLNAARKNGVRFFPVNPGHEAESWRLFASDALPRFLADRYDSTYEARLVAEFEALLPSSPPWDSA